MIKNIIIKKFSLFILFYILVFPSVVLASPTTSLKLQVASLCGNGVINDGEQCDDADLGIASCSNKGFDDGVLQCNNACKFDFSSCNTQAEDKIIAQIDSDGGLFEFIFNGMEIVLIVPSNAYSSDLSFQAFSQATSTEPLPEGKLLVGNVYEFNFLNSSGDYVHDLNDLVAITIQYTDEDISGIDESSIELFHREEEGDWLIVNDRTLNTSNNTVSFRTDQFSEFILLANPGSSQNEDDSPTRSSGGRRNYINNIVSIPGSIIESVKDTFRNVFIQERADDYVASDTGLDNKDKALFDIISNPAPVEENGADLTFMLALIGVELLVMIMIYNTWKYVRRRKIMKRMMKARNK